MTRGREGRATLSGSACDSTVCLCALVPSSGQEEAPISRVLYPADMDLKIFHNFQFPFFPFFPFFLFSFFQISGCIRLNS